ncbi:hypothetical protein [Streptomyces sp. SID8016]
MICTAPWSASHAAASRALAGVSEVRLATVRPASACGAWRRIAYAAS